MKLLLTSAGFSNKSIIEALEELVSKPTKELKLAFNNTASNFEAGDKSEWLIKDLIDCKNMFAFVDIVDISALPREIWEPRLREADVLLFEGGNTFHLMHWIKKSGLDKLFPELLKDKIYIGISAGSMVMTQSLFLSESKLLYDEDPGDVAQDKALGYVDFNIMPHFNSADFSKVNEENLERISKDSKYPIYALDDNSAIKVVDDKVEVISEGEWKKF